MVNIILPALTAIYIPDSVHLHTGEALAFHVPADLIFPSEHQYFDLLELLGVFTDMRDDLEKRCI